MALRIQAGLLACAVLTACGAETTSRGDSSDQNDSGTVAATPCQQSLLDEGLVFQPTEHAPEHPDGGPDLACTIEDPVVLGPRIRGVLFRPDAFGNAAEPLLAACALARALGTMAEMLSERGVVELVHFGTYGCRVIAGTQELSEHARANAFDLGEVRMTDGREFSVLRDWELGAALPVGEGGQFWRVLSQDLYREEVFHVILTPEYNADHADHIHMDLAEGVRYLSE